MLQPDGSVVIPAALAQEVLRRLSRSLLAEARSAGVPASRAAMALLAALEAATHTPDASAGGSDAGTVSGGPPTVDVSVGEAAVVMGCSTRWVRRLVVEGRVAARRVGPVWAIDSADLDRYRHGKAS